MQWPTARCSLFSFLFSVPKSWKAVPASREQPPARVLRPLLLLHQAALSFHREPGHLLRHSVIAINISVDERESISSDSESRKWGGGGAETGNKLGFVGDSLRRPSEKEETGCCWWEEEKTAGKGGGGGVCQQLLWGWTGWHLVFDRRIKCLSNYFSWIRLLALNPIFLASELLAMKRFLLHFPN